MCLFGGGGRCWRQSNHQQWERLNKSVVFDVMHCCFSGCDETSRPIKNATALNTNLCLMLRIVGFQVMLGPAGSSETRRLKNPSVLEVMHCLRLRWGQSNHQTGNPQTKNLKHPTNIPNISPPASPQHPPTIPAHVFENVHRVYVWCLKRLLRLFSSARYSFAK